MLYTEQLPTNLWGRVKGASAIIPDCCSVVDPGEWDPLGQDRPCQTPWGGGRGGVLQNWRGKGQVKFYPYERGGQKKIKLKGAQQVLR